MVKWTVNLFINVIVTMIAIYVVKTVSEKFNIPVLKQVSQKV